jgi:hypothetical protein
MDEEALLFIPEDGSIIFLRSVGRHTGLQGATSHKTVLFIFTAVRTSNPTQTTKFDNHWIIG